MNKNNRKNITPLNTNVNRSTTKGEGSAVVELGDMDGHIQNLRYVSLATQKLMNHLGEQLQGLSETIPLWRGFEAVKELSGRSKESRDGMRDAFEPLRAHIEREKSLFYTKNAEAIQKIIRERVKQGIKRRLPIVLEERLARYEEYLEINSTLVDKVKQVMTTTSVRAANSILCPSYPNEKVALILPHPNWGELMLGNLKNIGGPAVARLAKDQGLTPSEDLSDPEQTRINNLNMILTHLGVPYQAVPSWNGLLLTSLTGNTNY